MVSQNELIQRKTKEAYLHPHCEKLFRDRELPITSEIETFCSIIAREVQGTTDQKIKLINDILEGKALNHHKFTIHSIREESFDLMEVITQPLLTKNVINKIAEFCPRMKGETQVGKAEFLFIILHKDGRNIRKSDIQLGDLGKVEVKCVVNFESYFSISDSNEAAFQAKNYFSMHGIKYATSVAAIHMKRLFLAYDGQRLVNGLVHLLTRGIWSNVPCKVVKRNAQLDFIEETPQKTTELEYDHFEAMKRIAMIQFYFYKNETQFDRMFVYNRDTGRAIFVSHHKHFENLIDKGIFYPRGNGLSWGKRVSPSVTISFK